MNTVDHYTELQEVLERMRVEFSQNDVVQIGFYRMSRPDAEDPFHDLIACSGIVSEWPEGIYYEEATKTFFYYGELPPAWGAEKTHFPITGELLIVLPESVQSSLMRVAQSGVPETHPFDNQQLITF